MSRMRFWLAAPLAATALMAAPVLARAADFYQGKTVTVVVGFSPGGGFDAYARLVARFLGKHIPGQPNVILQNMPGAGSLTAARSIDVTQVKDGTVVVVFNPGLVTESFVEPDVVKLDSRKIAWVGDATPVFNVCYGYGPKGIESWDALMKAKQFVLGSPATGSGNYTIGATLRLVFHAPVKQIVGFPGSAEQRIAIEQGELDGDCGSVSSIPSDWIRDGSAHIFVRFSKNPAPGIPTSAAYIGNFAETSEQKQLLDVLDTADGERVGRPFAASSEVPADRLAILRKAFDETMQDPELLAQAKKEELSINPLTGQETEAVLKRVTDAPPAILVKAKEIFE